MMEPELVIGTWSLGEFGMYLDRPGELELSNMTNLANPDKPFGDPGRTPGPETPTVAALAVTVAGVGLVYFPFDAREPRDLGIATDQGGFVFGYEFIARGTGSEADMVAALDHRLVECDRHVEVIAGHGLAGALEPLYWAAEGQVELARVDTYARLWGSRRDLPATADVSALMVDTAFDLEISSPDLRATCAAAKVTSAYLVPRGDVWRGAITAAAASALLAARSLGWCSWQVLDLDSLVTGSACESR
jgi:hypothetical protein